MPQELFYLRQLFGGSAQGWLQVTLLGFLFLVLVFKPDRIHNRSLFRVACLLFALSVIVPPVLTFGVSFLADGATSSYRNYGPTMGESPLMLSLTGVWAPVLCGTSAMCALLSLIPGREGKSPFEAAKHPLD